MELKKITVDQDNAQTKAPSLAKEVLVEVSLPLPPVEGLDKYGVLKKCCGMSAPTSPFQVIQPILKCPPAPRKSKAAPLRKRTGFYSTELRLLDFSNDVLALYPPVLLADFGNKMKKAKKEAHHDQQQLKENICTNLNYFTC